MADGLSGIIGWSEANLSAFCPWCPFISAGLLLLFGVLRLTGAVSTHPSILAAAALSFPHALYYTFHIPLLSWLFMWLVIPSFPLFLLAAIGSVSSFFREKEKIDMYAILVLSVVAYALEVMVATGGPLE